MHSGSSRGTVLFALSLTGLLLPTAAYADVVWPALMLEPRLLSIPVIVSGLLVEAAMLRFGFQMPWTRAASLSLTVNAISTVAGIIAIPAAGIVWEFFPGTVLYQLLKMGTFNPLTWTATFLLATLVTTAIEVACLRGIFGVPATRRTWALWSLANAASVGLAFSSLFITDDAFGAYKIWLFA